MNVEELIEKFKKANEEFIDVWQDGKEMLMPENIKLMENANKVITKDFDANDEDTKSHEKE